MLSMISMMSLTLLHFFQKANSLTHLEYSYKIFIDMNCFIQKVQFIEDCQDSPSGRCVTEEPTEKPHHWRIRQSE